MPTLKPYQEAGREFLLAATAADAKASGSAGPHDVGTPRGGESGSRAAARLRLSPWFVEALSSAPPAPSSSPPAPSSSPPAASRPAPPAASSSAPPAASSSASTRSSSSSAAPARRPRAAAPRRRRGR